MKIVAVTACPTGIAHTYMAAARLEKVGKSLGFDIKVETQGAMGIENELSDADVASAEAVILASDVCIERVERFDRLRRVSVPVGAVLKDPESVFAQLK